MGIIERIRQIQQEKMEQFTKERAVLEAKAEQSRIQNEEENRRTEQKKLIEQQNIDRILQESGIFAGIKKIDTEILAKMENTRHEIVRNDKEIDLRWTESHSWDDYKFVRVTVNPEKNTITITGKEAFVLQEEDWEKTETIEGFLVNVFFEPQQYHHSSYHDSYLAEIMFGAGGPN